MHRNLSLASILLLLATLCVPALAQENAAAVLEEAGLSRHGSEFVLEQETEIIRARRDITQAQRDLEDAERAFREAENLIGRAQQYIAGLEREITELRSRARRADSRNEFDRHVTAIEQLVSQIEQAQEERGEFEQEQQGLIDDARAAYIETIYNWVERAQVITEQYAAIQENQDITDAIAAVMEADGRRYALGPSRQFQAIQRQLSQAAAEYQRGAVDLRNEGNVMLIDVRINGNPIRSMILDTGASSISLPFSFAQDLGITASDTDPVIQLQMADGEIIDARQIHLESVQVGEFIVRNVEAFILPANLHAAPALLGNSFLGQFTYEIDPERGKLILSRHRDGEAEAE